ncbi:hypothetical protein EG68_12282, partial [Paragonimus skrjabini miyazakii]
CKVLNWYSSFEDVRNAYQKALVKTLPSSSHTKDPNEHWEQIAEAMRACCEQACSDGAVQLRQNWISVTSINLTNKRLSILPGSEYDDDRRELKRKLTESLRKDREQSKEMERTFSSRKSRRFFFLIRGCTGRRVGVSVTIYEKDGSLITSQSRRLDRWAEHFEEQFSWPQPGHVDDGTRLVSYCVPDGPLSEAEMVLEFKLLKRNKVASSFQGWWGEVDVRTDKTPPDDLRDFIPVFKKRARSLCDNHRGIGLVSVVSNLLTGLILRRLAKPGESQIREEQAGFRSARECIDHIFTLRRILERQRLQTAVVLLDLKAAFDSAAHHF